MSTSPIICPLCKFSIQDFQPTLPNSDNAMCHAHCVEKRKAPAIPEPSASVNLDTPKESEAVTAVTCPLCDQPISVHQTIFIDSVLGSVHARCFAIQEQEEMQLSKTVDDLEKKVDDLEKKLNE